MKKVSCRFYNLRKPFLRTWGPSFWNINFKGDSVPISQFLSKDRRLTSNFNEHLAPSCKTTYCHENRIIVIFPLDSPLINTSGLWFSQPHPLPIIAQGLKTPQSFVLVKFKLSSGLFSLLSWIKSSLPVAIDWKCPLPYPPLKSHNETLSPMCWYLEMGSLKDN